MNKQELLDIIAKAREEKRSLTEEEKNLINSEIEARQNPEPQAKEEEPKAEEPEVKAEEPKEEPQVEEPKAEEERNKDNKSINTQTKMEKRYNFLAELRNAYETGKKINLNEVRAYTVAAEGEDVVQTDIYDIWMPLRQKNVLVEAGAKVISGIKNNVQIPLMGKVSCSFAGETSGATDGSGSFSAKKLTPKRITAKYPISLQLLAQDSIGVENAVRQEISNALYSKLEETLLGAGAGDDDTPAGIFNGMTSANTTTVTAFSGITGMEAKLEGENVGSEIKYILSPTAKAGLRNMPKSSKSTELVLQNGEIDGTPAISTSNISGDKFVVGDFSNLVIATWDNVEIDVVRDVASVGNGVVTIVVNAFVDGKVIRPEAFQFGKLS